MKNFRILSSAFLNFCEKKAFKLWFKVLLKIAPKQNVELIKEKRFWVGVVFRWFNVFKAAKNCVSVRLLNNLRLKKRKCPKKFVRQTWKLDSLHLHHHKRSLFSAYQLCKTYRNNFLSLLFEFFISIDSEVALQLMTLLSSAIKSSRIDRLAYY